MTTRRARHLPQQADPHLFDFRIRICQRFPASNRFELSVQWHHATVWAPGSPTGSHPIHDCAGATFETVSVVHTRFNQHAEMGIGKRLFRMVDTQPDQAAPDKQPARQQLTILASIQARSPAAKLPAVQQSIQSGSIKVLPTHTQSFTQRFNINVPGRRTLMNRHLNTLKKRTADTCRDYTIILTHVSTYFTPDGCLFRKSGLPPQPEFRGIRFRGISVNQFSFGPPAPLAVPLGLSQSSLRLGQIRLPFPSGKVA